MESFITFYLRLCDPNKENQNQRLTNTPPSAGDGHIGTSIPEKSKMRLHTPASVGKMTISLTQRSDPQTGDPPRSINKAI